MMPYLPNLPLEVQGKVERLAECRKQIANLESQLMQIKNERDQLEEELFGYRVDAKKEGPEVVRGQIMVATTSMNVQNLPNEMLILIFEYFLAINHRLIRRLLLVCKHWNHIVMQSPRLWGRVQLLPLDYEYRYPFESLLPYVEACLQRSQSVLLDIELDYVLLLTREEYIRNKVLATICEISNDEPNVIDQVYNLNCDFASPEYDAYFDQTMKELSILIGPMGAHMEKWRSLRLRIPWQDCILGLHILRMLCGAVPNLQNISLIHIGYIMDTLGFECFYEEDISFLSFPSVQSLKLDHSAATFLLEDLVRTPSTLMHLEICYGSDLGRLSTFTSLRTLVFRTRTGLEKPPVSKNEALSITLPELRELTLWWDSRSLKSVQFDLPNLQRLQVCGGPEFQLPTNLLPEYIHWSAGDARQTQDTIQSTLEAILQSSSRATVVSIVDISRENYELVLEELHKASRLPVSLKTIVFDLAGGERVHIDAATLRS